MNDYGIAELLGVWTIPVLLFGPTILGLIGGAALAMLVHRRRVPKGYRLVKDVRFQEGQRPGFDLRSYEVGYIDGENSKAADAIFEREERD